MDDPTPSETNISARFEISRPGSYNVAVLYLYPTGLVYAHAHQPFAADRYNPFAWSRGYYYGGQQPAQGALKPELPCFGPPLP